MKKKLGRPTVMTDEVIRKLEEAFLMGMSDKKACLLAGITDRTLQNYYKRNPKFVLRRQQLKQALSIKARKTLVRGLDQEDDDKAANFAIKLLEKIEPDEFGPKQRVEYSGTIRIGADVANEAIAAVVDETGELLEGEVYGLLEEGKEDQEAEVAE